MTVKLSKQSLLHILPICSQVTPVALSLLASTYACGQTVQNRYSVPNPYTIQGNPVYTYPSGTPSVQITPNTVHSYEVHQGYQAPQSQPALRYAPQAAPAGTVYEVIPPRRPQAAVQGSPYSQPQIVPPTRAPSSNTSNVQPSVPLKPVAPAKPNFADVQEVGRGLGTPGLITPGSVQRMEQSGLVVEDFRPPQPRPEDFSLEGLPPEARRDFYDQLQLPDGGRVMSARILSTESAPPAVGPTNPAPSDIPPSRAPQSGLPAPQHIAPAVPQAGSAPVLEAPLEAKPPEPAPRSIPALPPQEKEIEAATAPILKATVLPVKPEPVELESASKESSATEERYAKQYMEMQSKLQKLAEQNAALESMLSVITERLSKLEQSNIELAKRLDESSKLKETDIEKPKLEKQEAAPSDKDKAPEKKGKKKPKDRIEV